MKKKLVIGLTIVLFLISGSSVLQASYVSCYEFGCSSYGGCGNGAWEMVGCILQRCEGGGVVMCGGHRPA